MKTTAQLFDGELFEDAWKKWLDYCTQHGDYEISDLPSINLLLEVLCEKVPERFQFVSAQKTKSGWLLTTNSGTREGAELVDLLKAEVVDVLNNNV